MEMVAPSGPVYQAGTLSGNPLAMAAGLAALTHIKNNPDIYKVLEEKGAYLEKGISENLKSVNKRFAFNRIGSMFTLFFTEEEVNDFHSAVSSDTGLYGRYFHEMLNQGIYLAPAQFETQFISSTHTTEDLDKTIAASKIALEKIV
jgi:glutamate-1-semialdehyde 2,1-aminomutase